MSRKIERRFTVYKTLQSALSRAGQERPGALAGFLLECFLEGNSIITAKAVEKAGLCSSEGFKEWRDPLIKGGWLVYDYELAKKMSKGSYHQAGKRLLPYLNKEKIKTKTIVTEDMLRLQLEDKADKSALFILSETVDKLLTTMIHVYDPPFTLAKMSYYRGNPDELITKAPLTRLVQQTKVGCNDLKLEAILNN